MVVGAVVGGGQVVGGEHALYVHAEEHHIGVCVFSVGLCVGWGVRVCCVCGVCLVCGVCGMSGVRVGGGGGGGGSGRGGGGSGSGRGSSGSGGSSRGSGRGSGALPSEMCHEVRSPHIPLLQKGHKLPCSQ
eukprot:CAMPEP_0173182842 /NCGR_PEP_ID=MMETSP1141-20130122/8069_1 /TAXON_ID=483371 /ORGANISM="non described non described, Strain CCMP2298" /LENGTH=130 /DNA_ID=CAMNT_0014105995 /DNA_START=925 /DNA_END=1314 /DNA_ORIENTATION=+